MVDVRAVDGAGGPARIDRTQQAKIAETRPKGPCGRPDRVEISDVARFLDELARMPEIRAEKVEQVRRAIAEGTYLTPEKLDLAIERLLNELG